MSRRASDIAAQVQRMTSSFVQVPTPRRRSSGLEPSDPGQDFRRRTINPRFTVIMPREQHHFIKQLALDLGSDASTITRTLFSILQADPSLTRRLRQELSDTTSLS